MSFMRPGRKRKAFCPDRLPDYREFRHQIMPLRICRRSMRNLRIYATASFCDHFLAAATPVARLLLSAQTLSAAKNGVPRGACSLSRASSTNIDSSVCSRGRAKIADAYDDSVMEDETLNFLRETADPVDRFCISRRSNGPLCDGKRHGIRMFGISRAVTKRHRNGEARPRRNGALKRCNRAEVGREQGRRRIAHRKISAPLKLRRSPPSGGEPAAGALP